MKKHDVFTDDKYDICINWITKKVKQLIKLKSSTLEPTYVIDEVVCSCQVSNIGDAVRNVKIRWQEDEDTQKNPEPAKHLKNNPTHSFTWNILLLASSVRCMTQIIEALIIALKRPSLNE